MTEDHSDYETTYEIRRKDAVSYLQQMLQRASRVEWDGKGLVIDFKEGHPVDSEAGTLERVLRNNHLSNNLPVIEVEGTGLTIAGGPIGAAESIALVARREMDEGWRIRGGEGIDRIYKEAIKAFRVTYRGSVNPPPLGERMVT